MLNYIGPLIIFGLIMAVVWMVNHQKSHHGDEQKGR